MQKIYIDGEYKTLDPTKKAVQDIIGNAPEELDTFLEVAESIKLTQDQLKNVTVETADPINKNDEGKLTLKISNSFKIDNMGQLSLIYPNDEQIGGVVIGTGYRGDWGGLYNSMGLISLLPPGVHGNSQAPSITGVPNSIGGIKSANVHKNTPTLESVSNSGKYYLVETDLYGRAFVNVPSPPSNASLDNAGLVRLSTEYSEFESNHYFPIAGKANINNASYIYTYIPKANLTSYGVVKVGQVALGENLNDYETLVPVGITTDGTISFKIGTGLVWDNRDIHIDIDYIKEQLGL